MKFRLCAFISLLLVSFSFAYGAAWAQNPAATYEPTIGQEGKDVVWVPTPYALVEKMLDVAKVTAQDYVIDLGSGDGRNIIAAAKRGARALGVEYNSNMVELSRRNAAKEGVAEKAQFIQGDMYEADISQATVLALFLLPENMRRLTPKFLELAPGSRIVANGFEVPGWEADRTERSEGECGSWCTAYLYIVPAKVEGTWRLPFGDLTLEQKFQTFSGTLAADGATLPVENGRLAGDRFSFKVSNVTYTGRVSGERLMGDPTGNPRGAWTATRAR